MARPDSPLRRPRNRATGYALQVFAMLLGATVLGLLVYRQWFRPDRPRSRFHSDTEGVYYDNLGFAAVVGGLVGMVAIALFKHGRQLAAESAADLLRLNAVHPVVLLRRFADDALQLGSRRVFLVGTIERTFAEVLEEAFRPFGRMVAIGKPSEPLPEIGAARLYAGDDWQERVLELLALCQRVVVMLGHSEGGDGLAWEVGTVRRLKMLDKLIVVVPPYPEEEARRRWNQARALLKGLPEYQGGELSASFADGAWIVHRTHRRGAKEYLQSLPLQVVRQPLPQGRLQRALLAFLLLVPGLALVAWLAWVILRNPSP